MTASVTQVTGGDPVPPPVADALAAALGHRSVVEARLTLRGSSYVIEADFDAELPSRFMGAGASPSGVRPVETAFFDLPPGFPHAAPVVTLRPDFNSALPHVNPHIPGAPVPPCVVYGSLAEVFHSRGFVAILDQTADWIRKAGRDELINPAQGWEPIRRESAEDSLAFDIPHIAGLVRAKGGFERLPTGFIRYIGSEVQYDMAWGSVGRTTITPTRKNFTRIFDARSDDVFLSGTTLSVVCWADKMPSGEPRVCNVYMPDSVTTVGDLLARADSYGCGDYLRSALRWIAECARAKENTRRFDYPLFVILCVRRPYPVIGTGSNIEIIAYRFNIVTPGFYPDGDATKVFTVSQRHAITEPLLRSMSGLPTDIPRPRYTMVGCGSLGSKIAVHLSRASFVPSALVDKGVLDPHHMARHGLLPTGPHGKEFIAPFKDVALAKELAPFGAKPDTVSADITTLSPRQKDFGTLFPDGTKLVINATASYVVRDYLAVAPGIVPRVAEAALLDEGRVGFFSLEGPDRNPNTLDLMALTYEEMRGDGTLKGAIGAAHTARTVPIGQGCSSVTVTMTDGRLSMHAAAVAEKTLGLLAGDLPGCGELLIGRTGEDGMSVGWSRTEAGPTHVVAVADDPTWTVRVLDRAHRKIMDDVARYPHVETGGLIVGRVSPVRRVVHVTDVLEAPPDSIRSAAQFVLGVEGRDGLLADYEAGAAGALWCLGTWHSHLADQGPSPTDRKTARSLEGRGHRAMVVLIRRPGGYSALVVPGG
ncbi:Mov34/MPN/PAD-1 family protein [Azospirillum sp. HJ39]|uniref:Mov34/MPN/PAD-1 family protein n=1 Tax=Azospirillum sp. HJ39 TaxID=3159496 RepID=UPI0035588D13